MVYQAIVTGMHLLICSYTDIRWKKIYRFWILSYFTGIVIGYLAGQHPEISSAISGLFLGLLCMVICVVTHEGLGYGDGILILLCGLSMGGVQSFWILMSAFFWSAVYALGVSIGYGFQRNREMPFVPCLWLGFLIQGAGGMFI